MKKADLYARSLKMAWSGHGEPADTDEEEEADQRREKKVDGIDNLPVIFVQHRIFAGMAREKTVISFRGSRGRRDEPTALGLAEEGR